MVEKIAFNVSGMHCASCVGRAEKALTEQDGVVSAVVNLVNGTAYVTSDGASFDTLKSALSAVGYGAELRNDAAASDALSEETELSWRRFVWALVLTLPVFLVEMGGHLYPPLHHWVAMTIGQNASWLIQTVLISAVLVGPGRVFFVRGTKTLLRAAPDMNALVALGAGSAWAYSMVSVYLPHLLPENAQTVYFESAGVIITLILLGRFLEARAKGRAGATISALMQLRPETAMRLVGSSTETVAIAELKVDDLIAVKPGERIAADGLVVDGGSVVDEAMLTGESMPVEKQSGDEVSAGTLNKDGYLVVMLNAVGRDTKLAKIMDMVDGAHADKSPIRAHVDRITSVFVPVVMAISAITFLGWMLLGGTLAQALVAAVSVLIIACPCAMGLAVPVSVVVATGRAAQFGVLFRGGDSLETLGKSQCFAFDKTGTLTEGKPKLETFNFADGQNILGRVAALEAQSEHPLAQAVVEAVPQIRGRVSDFKAHAGLGIQGKVDGDKFAVGSARFMERLNVDFSEMAQAELDMMDSGATPIFVAMNGKAAALLGVMDPVRPDAKSALEDLAQDGTQIALITGDRGAIAAKLARNLPIDDVRAELMPEDKQRAVKSLQAKYGTVTFVGDGINDAPALATADVGVAIGGGTDVALETADVVLMTGKIAAIPQAVQLSRATMRNIRQNLFWAFGYNIALIPIAMGVFYPIFGWQLSPMLAAGAMALSSVFVVVNALRLRAA